MLHRLKPNEYQKVRPLFRALDHHLAVTAIIEGTTQSSIYVDDPIDPHTAVTWSYNRIFLAGSPSNTDFNTELPTFKGPYAGGI